MKLTKVFSWKMSIHFMQFQEDALFCPSVKKKVVVWGGYIAHPRLRPNPALLRVTETLRVASSLRWLAAVSRGRLGSGRWAFTCASWEGDRNWRTLSRALPAERLPFFTLIDNLHPRLRRDWAVGFFSDLSRPAAWEQKACTVRKWLLTL